MYADSFPRLFLACLITLVLTACGGGSGGGTNLLTPSPDTDTDTGTGSGTSVGTITLSISGLVDETGAEDNVLAGNEFATLTAQVTENGDSANLVVLFETSIGRLLQTSAQSTDGTATVQIAGDGIAGAATVTASATLSDGTQINTSIIVQTSADSPKLVLLAGDGTAGTEASTIELRAAETEQLTVQVIDWDGDKISGVGVTFSSTSLTLDATSGVTNTGVGITLTLTGTETQATGTLTATAALGSFSLSESVAANSLGVDTSANRITLDTIELTDGVLDGNEKVTVTARVLEDGVAKDAISVTFTTTAGSLIPASDTTGGGGVASVQLIGDGVAGTIDITASATLSNGISVSDTQNLQATATKPTIDLVARAQSGVIVTSFGANQELTLEATILDHDGGALDADDAALSITFDVRLASSTTQLT